MAEGKADSPVAPLKEADLEGHLENGSTKKDGKAKDEDAKKKRLSLVNEDYAIFEAINVLKGMSFTSSAAK